MIIVSMSLVYAILMFIGFIFSTCFILYAYLKVKDDNLKISLALFFVFNFNLFVVVSVAIQIFKTIF